MVPGLHTHLPAPSHCVPSGQQVSPQQEEPEGHSTPLLQQLLLLGTQELPQHFVPVGHPAPPRPQHDEPAGTQVLPQQVLPAGQKLICPLAPTEQQEEPGCKQNAPHDVRPAWHVHWPAEVHVKPPEEGQQLPPEEDAPQQVAPAPHHVPAAAEQQVEFAGMQVLDPAHIWGCR